MAGKQYFRWMPGDCWGSAMLLGSIFRPWVGQLKYLQDQYRYDLIVFPHFRQLQKLCQARNISRGCPVTAGSEILLGSILRPQVWQLKDLQHKYSSHPIIFAHFRQSTNVWQARNISGGCGVTVPDRN